MSRDKSKVVGSMSEWSGLLKDFFRQINDGGITLGMLGDIIEHRNPFVIEIEEVKNSISEWKVFYQKLFGIDLRQQMENLEIPIRKKGFDKLIIIAQGMTSETLYVKCKELFPCWRWTNDDLDKIVTENERIAKSGPYAIWVKNEVEADENLKNKSANDIKAMNLKTETLAERLIHELKFFDETGEHLDIKNITLCTGSRCSGVDVPVVDWCDDGVGIDWYYSGYYGDDLRSRQVVS